ncbi:MAG: MFS transporter [Pirellulaceae bacterium]
MSGSTRIKLMAMMFLQFFIWGAWLPQSFGFWEGSLGFKDWQAMALDFCFPISAIIAMFVGNQLVDRMFAAEKFLAVSQFIGGLAMLGFGFLARMAFTGDNPETPSFWMFLALMAVHCFFYVPGMSVTNAILFAHATDPKKDFGPIRLFGTIGWIAAAWPFIFILTDWDKVAAAQTEGFIGWLGAAMGSPLDGNALNLGKTWTFITAGIASLLLAGLSLALPHTPPAKAEKQGESLALVEAFRFLGKHPYLILLFIVTAIDATVHDGFFFFGFSYIGKIGVPQNWVQAAMTVGQLAEIGTMAFLGYVLSRLGWRYTLAIGVFGHAARFLVWAGIFAASDSLGSAGPWLAVGINVVHGICYAFFFATLYILVDIAFPKDARAVAQGLFNFLIFGLGPIVSRFVWRYINGMYTTEVEGVAKTDYSLLLLYPAGRGSRGHRLAALFRPPHEIEEQARTVKPEH